MGSSEERALNSQPAARRMENSYLRSVYWRLTGVIMAAVLLSLAGFSYFSHKAFERNLVPDVAHKASIVGASVRSLITKATSLGFDYRSLYGVQQAFDNLRSENPEFGYIGATDVEANILFQSGGPPPGLRAHALSLGGPAGRLGPLDSSTPPLLGTQYVVSLPIAEGDKRLGLLHIGIDQKFVQDVMLEVLLDVVVVLVVALFFTLELLNFIAGAPLASGLANFAAAVKRMKSGDFGSRIDVGADDEVGRVLRCLDSAVVRLNERYQSLAREVRGRLASAAGDTRTGLGAGRARLLALAERFRFGEGAVQSEDPGALARIRAPLFVFILAEELTRPFLPSYINRLLVPVPGVSPQIVIGLPIALFMLIVAIGQPWLGAWSERAGRSKAMLIGALLGAVGFFATALAVNLLDLLVWRSLCAVGYAIVFVAAQGYVLDHAKPEDRSQAFALFVGAIMVATICGPSIGGILADNLGERPSFLLSAVLCALSIFAIRRLPRAVGVAVGRPERAPKPGDLARLLVNGRFVTLTALAAMPAKIMLTGVCFYLVPLYAVSSGSTQAMAGRMLMVYAVMMVLVVPIAAQLADRGARREHLVGLGLVVSGMGGVALYYHGEFLLLFAVVFLLGLGQAISIAAQSAMVGVICRPEIQRYGEGYVYGAYRMLERLGNALGPLVAGGLVVHFGYPGAFIGISGFVLACGVLFILLTGSLLRAAPGPS